MVYLRLICLILCLFACANSDVQLTETQFEQDYISVTFSSDAFIEQIQVNSGTTVVYSQAPNQLLEKISLPFAWQEGMNYSLIINNTQNFKLKAPISQAKQFVSLQAPLGQKSQLLFGDSSFHSLRSLDPKIQAALFFNLDSKLKQDIRLQLEAEDSSKTQLDTLITLLPFNTKNYLLLTLDSKTSVNFNIKLSGAITHLAKIAIQPTSLAELKARTSLYDVHLPALANGDTRAFDKPNVIYLDDPVSTKMRRYFSALNFSKNLNSPATFVSVDLENKADQDIRYLAELVVFDGKTRHAHPAFVPNNWERNGFAPITKLTFNLAAKQRGRFALPLFVDRSLIRAGTYQAELRLKHFGTADVILQENFTFEIVYQQHSLLIVFLLLTFFGLLSFGYSVLSLSRKLKNIELQALITIAIFASIHLALNYILMLIDSSFLAILGPFKIFLTGFFTEALYYSVLVSLFMLFPRKDVIIIKLLLSFFLSIILSGAVTVSTFSTLGIHLAVFSVLFSFWSGKENRFWIFLILISLFDAAYSYYALLEMRLLYDYHYANWYMLIYALVIGFTYTAVGCLAGRYLGFEFRKVIAH